MRNRIANCLALLSMLALPSLVSAEIQVHEQALSFTEAGHGGHVIGYATIDLSGCAGFDVKTADLEFVAGCPDALGNLTLAAVSLWPSAPTNWEAALDPESSDTGLFFPAETEIEGSFHAEIGAMIAGWTSATSPVLVLAFGCGDVDCDCEPLIESAVLRISQDESEAP